MTTTVYEIQPNAPVRVKRIGSMWTGASIDFHTTVKTNTFVNGDMILDPTSIFAPVENCRTARIKARWMDCGYYGFRNGQWLMLVSKDLVIVKS